MESLPTPILMPMPTDVNVLKDYSFVDQSTFLGVREGQLTLVKKEDLTVKNWFLSFIGKGALQGIDLKLISLQRHLACYNWGPCIDPNADEHRAYQTVCEIAKRVTWYDGDNSLLTTLNIDLITEDVNLLANYSFNQSSEEESKDLSTLAKEDMNLKNRLLNFIREGALQLIDLKLTSLQRATFLGVRKGQLTVVKKEDLTIKNWFLSFIGKGALRGVDLKLTSLQCHLARYDWTSYADSNSDHHKVYQTVCEIAKRVTWHYHDDSLFTKLNVVPSDADANVLANYSFVRQSTFLGLRKGQLTVVKKEDLTIKNWFLSFIGKGALRGVDLKLTSLQRHLARYDWTSYANPNSNQYKAYQTACEIAKRVTWHYHDDSFSKKLSVPCSDIHELANYSFIEPPSYDNYVYGRFLGTNRNIQVTSSHNRHHNPVLLGVRQGQIVQVNRKYVTIWNQFLSFFGKGKLKGINLKLKILQQHLMEHDWKQYESKNPASDEYKAYVTVCKIAGLVMLHRRDDRFWIELSTRYNTHHGAQYLNPGSTVRHVLFQLRLLNTLGVPARYDKDNKVILAKPNDPMRSVTEVNAFPRRHHPNITPSS